MGGAVQPTEVTRQGISNETTFERTRNMPAAHKEGPGKLFPALLPAKCSWTSYLLHV